MFIEAKDDGGGGDNCSYKSSKAPDKSSPTTNQHPVFSQAGCPSCHPTNSVEALQVNSVAYCIVADGTFVCLSFQDGRNARDVTSADDVEATGATGMCQCAFPHSQNMP